MKSRRVTSLSPSLSLSLSVFLSSFLGHSHTTFLSFPSLSVHCWATLEIKSPNKLHEEGSSKNVQRRIPTHKIYNHQLISCHLIPHILSASSFFFLLTLLFFPSLTFILLSPYFSFFFIFFQIQFHFNSPSLSWKQIIGAVVLDETKKRKELELKCWKGRAEKVFISSLRERIENVLPLKG